MPQMWAVIICIVFIPLRPPFCQCGTLPTIPVCHPKYWFLCMETEVVQTHTDFYLLRRYLCSIELKHPKAWQSSTFPCLWGRKLGFSSLSSFLQSSWNLQHSLKYQPEAQSFMSIYLITRRSLPLVFEIPSGLAVQCLIFPQGLRTKITYKLSIYKLLSKCPKLV